jgi:glycosyltransferase involved in cell wall biosynthesis
MGEMTKKTLSVALVHDYLAEFGGAERVLLALHQTFPDAPVFTAFVDWRGFGGESQAAQWRSLDVRSTFIQKIPGHARLRSPLRILAPLAFKHLDLRAYDLVISSTNAYHAKSIRVRPDAVHLCYCHTPARSLYGYETKSDWREHRLSHFFGGIANHFLRLEDFRAAQAVTKVIANSKETKKRVAKFWHREAVVIPPPVTLLPVTKKPAAPYYYYLYVNRLNLAKHPELAVQACLTLKVPLKVVGTGPMLPALRELVHAHPAAQIEFLGQVGDSDLAQLYAGARGLLYPVVDEDFGLVPLEALAQGTPVIAHRSGGPQETLIDGQTGVFFTALTVTALVAAMRRAQTLKFSSSRLQAQAQKYSLANFQQQIKKQGELALAAA